GEARCPSITLAIVAESEAAWGDAIQISSALRASGLSCVLSYAAKPRKGAAFASKVGAEAILYVSHLSAEKIQLNLFHLSRDDGQTAAMMSDLIPRLPPRFGFKLDQ
ncbi:MAG: hypothetical protein RLZZ366_2235, partial [Pseudomonadota bacterium]